MNIGPAKPWLNVDGKLCENPLWNPTEQALYWTDILSGRLFSHSWAGGPPVRIYQGPVVGGFTLQKDGTLLLFRENDIAVLNPGENEAVSRIEFSHSGSTRFNDVIADPEGRVFAGTIGKTPESGGLFRVDRDGSLVQVASGTGCSNGMAFSLELDFFYWVCSTRRRIFKFPYSRATGALGEPVVFHQGSESEGFPDGLTMDSEGNLYSIRWGASQYGLMVFNPEGTVIHRQEIPPKASSSLCFCGPDLQQLAITSAEDETDPGREADLYRIETMPVKGRNEFRSRVE